MKDNNDGTVTYTAKEVENINEILQKLYNKINDMEDR
jgi:hypothetical protein